VAIPVFRYCVETYILCFRELGVKLQCLSSCLGTVLKLIYSVSGSLELSYSAYPLV